MSSGRYFERSAEYAAYRPSYPARLVDWLARIAPRRGRVWEAGCGSGQMSQPIGDRFDHVVATDESEAQLAHARVHRRVRYVAARAERAPLPAACADLVLVAQAVHWFDLPRFFDEVRRVARPDAAVALIAYGNAILDEAELEARFVRFYRDEIGAFWPPERQLIVDDYRTIDFPFDEIEAPRFELRETWSARQMLGYVETWSAIRAFERAGGDPAVVRAFADDLRALWGDGTRTVRWPVPLRAGRVSST